MFMYSEDVEKIIKNTSKLKLEYWNEVTNSINEYLYTSFRFSIVFNKHLYDINICYDKESNRLHDLDVYNYTNKKFIQKNINIHLSEDIKPILFKVIDQVLNSKAA